MIKSRLLPFALLSIIIGAASAQDNDSRSGHSAPDIVVFLTDDQSLLDTSLYGNRGMKSPNLEKLAAQGMVFNHAYVASPSCAPSRASLLTGLMPARHGAEPNHAKPRPEVKKWPSYFQDLGYQVHAFGKISHYKHTELFGFDSFAHDTFHDHASIPAAADFLKTRKRLQAEGSTTASKPLCLMVGSNWPHVPWPETAPDVDSASLKLPELTVDTPGTRKAHANLAQAVINADNDLGLIMKTVADTLSSTNTVFLFTSDHGTQWPFGKWNLYDEGIRVPLVVRWEGNIQPGSRSDAMVSWIDLLPTLLEAAGGKPPADIDGKSFMAVLTGSQSEHREQIFTTHSGDGHWNVYPIRAVTDRKFKYILNLHPEYAFTTHIDIPGELGRTNYWDTWEKVAVEAGLKYPAKAPAGVPPTNRSSGDFAKFVVNRYYARPAEELYDLRADPSEMNNIAADPAHAERLKAMRAHVEKFMEEQGDTKALYGKPHPLDDVKSYGPDADTVGQHEKKNRAKQTQR